MNNKIHLSLQYHVSTFLVSISMFESNYSFDSDIKDYFVLPMATWTCFQYHTGMLFCNIYAGNLDL